MLTTWGMYLSDANAADGRAFYSNNATTPVYRTYAGATNTFGAQTTTGLVGAAQGPAVMRAGTTRTEMMAGYVSTGGQLYILKQDTSTNTWTAQWNIAVGGTGVSGRRFDIAYEQNSGDAIVLYSLNAAGTELAYRIYNGTSWTAATNLNVGLGATAIWVKMDARPGTDQIAATVLDNTGATTARLITTIWDGSAWGNESSEHTGGLGVLSVTAAGNYDNFDQAWETLSGRLMVVWSQTAPQQYYRIYTPGTGWAAAVSLATARTTSVFYAESDLLSDDILLGFDRSGSGNMYTRIWTGATNTMGATNTCVTTGATAIPTNASQMNGGFVNAGGVTWAVGIANTTANNTVAYCSYNGSTWTNALSWTMTGTNAAKRWIDVDRDPDTYDRLLFTFNDTANDLWVKSVTFNGTTLTWANSDGGTALTATNGAANTYPPYDISLIGCIDADGATGFTINPPTGGTTITLQSSYLVQATVAGETSAPGTGTATITIAGTDAGACDVTNQAMTWNGASSKWEYTWNIAACGTTVADGGITIDARYTDPDCTGKIKVDATQITNITVDNTCSDGDPTTGFTINPPTSGTVVSGNYVIRGTVAGELTPGAAGSAASITIAGSTACNVTGAAMTWNSGNSKWEYTWNTGACGDPVESGITIDASYTDPNCFDVTPATQVSSIGIDNTDPYSIVGCGGCHLSPPADSAVRNTPQGAVTGSHNVHGNTLNLSCKECHVDNGIVGNPFPKGLAHRTGIINMTSLINSTANSSYSKGTNFSQTKTPTLGTCANTYCHSDGTDLVSPFTSTSPTWGGSTTCTTCHSKPPAYANGSPKANSHAMHSSNCSLCHNATTSDGGASITNAANHGNKAYDVEANAGQIASYTAGTKTCNNVCCHGGTSPVWGGASIACTTCHNGSVCSPTAEGLDAAVTSRRDVGGEFSMTWSHKRTASGVVTSNDCGVCHMEGIASTGLSNATYHANGYVELRDPDTGTTIYNAAWTGTGAGSLTNTADIGKFVRFSRNLASATLEESVIGIQKNHCLKCHDAVGAASTAARVPSGTALRPFNTAPTHTPGNNVLDVAAHFATTNQSYHPVLGKQNNSYADIDKMFAPWNQATKTAATTTQWGDLMSCWDCHAPLNTASTVTLTNTVTAHGGDTTLRGYPVATTYATGVPISGNTSPVVGTRASLCIICHKNYDNSGTNYSHGTNSAFSGNTGRSEKQAFLYYGCNMCHSSSWSVAVTRPTRSEDVHGTNTVPNGLNTKVGRWAAGTKNGPIAFIRNTNQFTDHAPVNITGTAYTPVCMGGASGNSTCTRTSLENYTVGGTY